MTDQVVIVGMMNQRVKQGVIIITVNLFIALLYSYLTHKTHKRHLTITDDVVCAINPDYPFSDVTLATPPSGEKSPSSSVSDGNDKSSMDELAHQPMVKEMNDLVKTETPDKLPQSVIDRIKTFVFFVGHARSGHSIVGSLMDGHPHMVISHEYDLFNKLANGTIAPNKADIFNALWGNTKQTIINGLRAKSTNYKGYTLFVDGLYQGKYVDHIDVIGDKKGGTTADLLAFCHRSWLKSFIILKSLNFPMKVVHVIRNPYDNIATIVLYLAIGEDEFGKFKQSNKSIKVQSDIVEIQIEKYFASYKAIVDATYVYNLDVIQIHGKDFISDPKETLLKICSGLGVTCYDNYLEICNKKIYKSESRTRHLLQWTDEQLEMIQQNIDKYNSLKDYTFHSM